MMNREEELSLKNKKNFKIDFSLYLIIQAPDDFPKRIRVGDKLLKLYYNLTSQFSKAELTGALFCLVAKK